MGIEVGQASKILKSGGKFYAYSGLVQGGPTLPAFVTLINILSTGLKDSYIKIAPFYGHAIAFAPGDALGIKILIDDVEVCVTGSAGRPEWPYFSSRIELFIPQQSKLEILSINTANNTLQDRGVTVLGWYL